MTDVFPADLTCTYTSTASGGATGNTAAGAGDLSETLNLPVGGGVTYTATCAIDSNATGTVSNTATVSSSLTDHNPGNNSASDDTSLSPEADVEVTKTDGLTEVSPGDQLTYAINVANNGPSSDPATSLSDTLPTSLMGCTFLSVASGGASGNTASGSGNLNESLDLPVGAAWLTPSRARSPLAPPGRS